MKDESQGWTPKCHAFILHPSAFILAVRAGVAQLVEHQPSKLRVASSSLVARSTLFV
jgi:hypothetical protein